MKTVVTIVGLMVLALINCQQVLGKVWRVNNTGLPADFTTAQLAHDNVNVLPGDTLYIEPSPVSYGYLAIHKRLIIMSTGNFLDVNPNLQYRTDAGTLGGVDIYASGTVLHCKTGTVWISNTTNSCRIERSFCTSTSNGGIKVYGNNNLILNSYIDGDVVFYTGSTGNILTNCIVGSYARIYSSASAIIVNNVLNATNSQKSSINNSIFENNIINKSGNTTYSFTNCTVRNNFSSGTELPVGNGNVNTVNMSSVFVNPSGTNDVSFVLLGGNNPAKGTGFNGEDCGAFGGSSPYLLGLQAAIPAIYQLNVPATASGSTMNISFSTKSNN